MPKPALAPVVCWTLLLACLGLTACRRIPPPPHNGKPSQSRQETSAAPADKHALPNFAVDAVDTHEGTAFWYDVPDQSLPQRRAWAGELTAASDTLPLNSYARVRRIDSNDPGKDVVVRVTDTGVHHKGGLIDLNRDAAEALGMIKIGEAKVRVETLAIENATTDKPVDKKDAPTAPKASDLNGKPAVGLQAEKDAANAKTNGSNAP